MSEAFRALPSVGRLVDSAELRPALERFGRARVVAAARAVVDAAREAIAGGELAPTVGPEAVLAALERDDRRRLRRVLNATGVVLHTNLGRAPLSARAIAATLEAAAGHSNLELDLETGRRGSRHDHARGPLTELTGADDALAVNNCAGAVLLTLAALARRGRAVVARGELVEIGGGFRVPDVITAAGARLIEVGTTNRVHLADYERAIGSPSRTSSRRLKPAKMLLKVHRSNFALVGFVAEPSLDELAGLARRTGLPLVVDLGSGHLDPALAALSDEPTPRAVLAAGADLVMFSGDKLLGGPQAGIVAGRGDLIQKLARHPLARALRLDKLGLAALLGTLESYRLGRPDELPVRRRIAATREEVAAFGASIAGALAAEAPDLAIEPIPGESRVGGGSAPLVALPTELLAIGEAGRHSRRMQAALRRGDPPVIARISQGRLLVDPRTLLGESLHEIVTCLLRAHRAVTSL